MTVEEKYLSCIDCGGDLKRIDKYLVCEKCGRKYGFEDGIVDCSEKMAGEKLFSRDKWDNFYREQFGDKDVMQRYEKEKQMYLTYGVNQIKKYFKVNKKSVYFELGCGTFYIGSMLAEECRLVVGIDFSKEALRIAKKIFDKKGIKNYLLIKGDIFKIPLKKETVDILYGGGVIEHFKDTNGCIKEFARVMKTGGVALNAVPLLNIGALTYRQIWGNIPDFPGLKQLAEWIHIKLLKGKHMYFGYELSFTRLKLKKLHRQNGFREIKFVRLDTEVMMGFLPYFLKTPAIYLAENCSWFWPMMLVVAKK